MVIEMCEDCFELPIWLRKLSAHYEFQPGTGHLYLIDKEATMQKGIRLHDLSRMQIPPARPRFDAQEAWLAGPQRGNLPVECFHSRIEADRQVFADFAAEAGLASTDDLFPSRASDPVLDALLSLPWLEIRMDGDRESKFDIPAFRRSLELPEYHDSFTKIHLPHQAFYRGTTIGEMVKQEGFNKLPFTIRDVPETVIFGHANPKRAKFPEIIKILEGEPFAAFEVKNLIRSTETGPSKSYGKGLTLQMKVDGLVELGELSVDHPGTQLVGCGVNRGWHYKIEDDGAWSRYEHRDDCPCGDDDRHERHFSALTILDHWLAKSSSFDPD